MTPIKSLLDILEGLDQIGIKWFYRDDLEADDVIATIIANDTERRTFIMSTDRDFYQLASDSVFVLNTRLRRGKKVIGRREILDRYGVEPDQWCDYRALTGDASDNIRGVRGVGPVTARRLLSGGTGLADMEPLGRLTGRIGEKIRDLRTWTELMRDRLLIKLRIDLSVPRMTSGTPTTEMPLAAVVLEELGLW